MGTFAVGTTPIGMAFDGANIWVTNSGSHTVMSCGLGRRQLGTFNTGAGPAGVAFDGANIWVANRTNTATKLRASDGANLGRSPRAPTPTGVAFDGANIWVANFSSERFPRCSQQEERRLMVMSFKRIESRGAVMKKSYSCLCAFAVVAFLALVVSLSAQQGPINPKAVAILRWYPANLTTSFSAGQGPSCLSV